MSIRIVLARMKTRSSALQPKPLLIAPTDRLPLDSLAKITLTYRRPHDPQVVLTPAVKRRRLPSLPMAVPVIRVCRVSPVKELNADADGSASLTGARQRHIDFGPAACTLTITAAGRLNNRVCDARECMCRGAPWIFLACRVQLDSLERSRVDIRLFALLLGTAVS